MDQGKGQPSKFYPEFATQLSQQLTSQERSATWLAGRLGINPSTVNRWLNHDTRPKDLETVARIADLLGIHDPTERSALLAAAGYVYQEASSAPDRAPAPPTSATSNTPAVEPAPDNSTKPPKGGISFADNGPIKIQGDLITGGMVNKTVFHGSVTGAVHAGSGDINLHLSSPKAIGAPPFMTPPRPTHGVFGRDDFLQQISSLLHLDNMAESDVPPVALHGMGGIGKTTLAIILGRRADIQRLFPEGVLWVAMGPQPTTRILLDQWGKALGVDLLPERDEDACRDRLRQLLYDRQVLLLIDDVWAADPGRYFTVAGPRGRTLITTRETPIAHELATRARSLRVDVLKPPDALALLGSLAPEAIATNQKLAIQLCERVEFLPLALTLAGRFLANEADVPARMARLLSELIERRATRLKLFQTEQRPGLEEKQPSLQAILGMSVERLDKVDQERFAMASVFGGEPLTWDINAAAFVWECSVEDAEATTARFIQRGLVARQPDGRYWMHALLADYAGELMEEMKL